MSDFVVEKKTRIELFASRWKEASGVRFLSEPVVLNTYDFYLAVSHFKSDPERKMVGITTQYDDYYSWNYALNKYFVPREVVEKTRESEFQKFFFDAGGSGRAVYAEAAEFQRAIEDLELI